MARTDVTTVKLIVGTTLTDPQVQQFIDDASLWVDNNIAAAGWDTGTAEAIERYLAAHWLTLRDRRKTTTRRGDLEDRYESTRYLEAAIALDTTGTVSEAFAATEDPPAFSFRSSAGYDSDNTKLGVDQP